MIEPPLPFGHASARWFYVLLRGLVNRGHQVTAFATCSKPEEIEATRDLFPSPDYDLRLYRHPTRINSIRMKWETIRRPYSYMFGADLRADLKAERERGFDVLHLEQIWSGWLNQSYDPSKVVLNIHSLYDLDQEKQTVKGIRDWLYKSLRRRAEKHLLRSCSTLLTLSHRLKDAVQLIAPQSSVYVVPLGIDTTLYPFISKEKRPLEPIISIIGSMGWYPSHSAAIRLLTRLWPQIKKYVPDARVQVVGWNARSALRDYLNLPDVEIVESVPTIRPYFECACVMVYAPERGSGMKVKILEAFAFGVPVVTTSEGVEGIPAEDGVHAGISEDDEGLIERTVQLLRDRDRQECQRLSARALLESHCGPQATLDAVEKAYSSIIGDPGA